MNDIFRYMRTTKKWWLIPLIVAFLPFVSFSAWTGVTSFETTDGSTSPTDGNGVELTGDGSGWSTNWAQIQSTENDYDNSQAYAGTWSLLQDTQTGVTNNEPRIERNIATTTTGYVCVNIRKSKTNRNDTGIALSLNTFNTGTNRATYTTFSPVTSGPGELWSYNGASFGVIVSGVQNANTWYELCIDFDATTDTYNIYLNGVKRNGTALNFNNSLTGIDRITLITTAASSIGSTAGTQTWYDNIRSGPTSVTETFIGTQIRGATIRGAVIK